MRVVKMLVLSGMAAVTCCFAAAGSAWATPGPLWGYCDAGGSLNADCGSSPNEGYERYLLQSGQSLLELGLSLGNQELKGKTAKESILCSGLHAHGYLEGGDPGKNLETLTYTGCSVPNLAGCDVNSQGQATGSGVIETKPLLSELVYLTKAGAEALNAEATGVLFRPQTGTTFVELLLTVLGTGSCAIPSNGVPVPVKGEVITENVEATKPLLLRTLVAPATPKTEYFLDTGIPATKDNITRINIGGVNATYIGEVSVKASLLGHFGEWLAFWVCP